MADVTVIGPEDMVKQWQQALPDEVVETFNDLLAQNFDGRFAIVREDDLLAALKEKGLNAKEVQEQRWLHQTYQLYKEAGWKADHRTPGWDDSFKPYFRFDIK